MSDEKNRLVPVVPVALHSPLLDADRLCSVEGGLAVPVCPPGRCPDFFYQPVLCRKIRQNPFHMNLFVEEIGTTADSTGSQLFVDGRPFCFVIEDGYREHKISGETRIPGGRYQVVKHKSGKFFEKYRRDFGHDFALQIANVPGFEWILIHTGNNVKDTKGCLLVNRNIGIQAAPRDYCGTDSMSVYKLLYLLIKAAFERGEEVWIEIERRPIIDENTPVG